MKILVVEDDSEIRHFLKVSLEAEFFVVDAAEDGQEGIELGRINDYDLILLDNVMPKKNGKEVCLAIREKKKDVPIIMLSVKSEIPDKLELLNIGADDYLTKPFSFEELLARIRNVIKRTSKRKEDLLKLGDLTLDVRKNVVKEGSAEIHLTKKEFMLLELLLSRKNEVLSRGVIMEHVWDMNADPFSNTIESHIANLRRKLKIGKEVIVTVPGRGYKVIAE